MVKTRRRKTILITAGPTREPIDPIRYLSNRSTGAMGYELAKAAIKRGYKVILISGPASLTIPRGATFIPVTTAREMKKAAVHFFRRADCAVMTAAVCDFRPAVFRTSKIKKRSKGALSLPLRRNPDIVSTLASIKGRRILAGYALETERPIQNAKRKLRSKNLDLILVNRAGGKFNPFGPGAKEIAIIDKKGSISRVKSVSKAGIAHILLDKLKTLW